MEAHTHSSLAADLMSITHSLRDLADKIESAAIEARDMPVAVSRRSHSPMVDPRTLSVRWNGHECVLGASIGFRLIQRLARRPNHYISHADLLDDVWGCQRSTATVRSAVRDLRRRLVEANMPELARRIDGTHRGYYALLLD
jgi:DNA-binding response OmpR family regulator